MPTTTTYALPYPVLTDTPDVPRDVKALADRVEAVLPTIGKTWDTERVSGNASDSWTSSNGFASMCILSVDSTAPAGRYRIDAIVIAGGSVATAANLRVTVGSTNISGDSRCDLSTSTQPLPFYDIYTHAGGAVTITSAIQITTGTGTVWKAGTKLTATYLGPS